MKNSSLFALLLCALGLFFALPQNAEIAIAAEKTENAKGYCVIEKSTGRVLAEENKDKRLPMASTTKIITAILAIENTEDLDKLHEIPAESVGIEGSSIYLKKGEHLSIRELLYGLMLRSGNDAAVALAVLTFGSVEGYQKAANDFVAKLGLVNTHIVTPNGLHDDNHYTSAHDLAIISAYALSNETFREIVCTQKTTISNELGKGKRVLKNKNKMLSSFDGATGVKTGYTKKAGRCLVSSAKRDGMELICVVLGCPDWFNESTRLLENAFSNYSMVKLVPEHFHVGTINVKNGDRETVNLVARQGFCYPLSSKELSNVHIETKLKENVEAPVGRGKELGQILVYNENNLIFSENVYSIEEVESTKFGDVFKKIWSKF